MVYGTLFIGSVDTEKASTALSLVRVLKTQAGKILLLPSLLPDLADQAWLINSGVTGLSRAGDIQGLE